MEERDITAPLIKQPKSVTIAIWLLIVSLALGFAVAFIAKYTGALQINTDSPGKGMFISIVTYLVMVAFIYLLNKGEKWARTVFIILYAIGFLIYLIIFFSTLFVAGIHLLDELPVSLTAVLSAIQTMLQLIAIILLFSQESNKWFNLKK